jgi:hypothetical protein
MTPDDRNIILEDFSLNVGEAIADVKKIKIIIEIRIIIILQQPNEIVNEFVLLLEDGPSMKNWFASKLF